MMQTIRIMTWNVHGTFNLNPDFDLEGVCSIIDKWSPDVIALQEIDSRGRKDDVFARLAAAVGEHRVEARSIVTQDGDYGQVLLSRWPFAGTPKVTDVSYQEREPRRAISVAIQFPIGEVTVVATHLGLSIHERHAQAQALAALVVAPRTIVMGDFNDWFWVKSVRRGLASRCPVRTRLRTFPSRLPILRLDRIYVTRNGTIVKAWTDREARAYSDHLPVLADIAFEDVAVALSGTPGTWIDEERDTSLHGKARMAVWSTANYRPFDWQMSTTSVAKYLARARRLRSKRVTKPILT